MVPLKLNIKTTNNNVLLKSTILYNTVSSLHPAVGVSSEGLWKCWLRQIPAKLPQCSEDFNWPQIVLRVVALSGAEKSDLRGLGVNMPGDEWSLSPVVECKQVYTAGFLPSAPRLKAAAGCVDSLLFVTDLSVTTTHFCSFIRMKSHLPLSERCHLKCLCVCVCVWR